MPWTSFTQVRSSYEHPDQLDPVQAWVETKIGEAERLLKSRRPNLQVLIDAGRVPVENVRDAVVNAVLRVVRNPEGMQSETEGNYLYSVQRDVAGGKLFFTGDDYALVTPAAIGAARGPIRSDIPNCRIPGLGR